MTLFRTILFTSFSLLILSACGSSPEQSSKTNTVIDDKLQAVQDVNQVVETVNTKDTPDIAPEQSPQNESMSGSSLYAGKCSSCHGENAKKSAFNSSQIIAGWSAKKISTTLNGYKNGTYGGKMKGIMEGQSKPLSEEEIRLIAEYISVL